MARFRRTFRRKFRRSRFDLQSSLYCRLGFQVSAVSTCTVPTAYATMLAGPFTTLPNQNLASPGAFIGAKNWTFGGAHFQIEWSINPALWSFQSSTAVDIIELYEAVCILPLLEGSITSPAVLPRFTNTAAGFQVGDAGCRVLWKRINIMPFWGSAVIPSIQLQSTMRDEGHGPQIIRAKARMSEREGLFHVFNVVHGQSDPALPGPVVLDGWFRTAIKASL